MPVARITTSISVLPWYFIVAAGPELTTLPPLATALLSRLVPQPFLPVTRPARGVGEATPARSKAPLSRRRCLPRIRDAALKEDRAGRVIDHVEQERTVDANDLRLVRPPGGQPLVTNSIAVAAAASVLSSATSMTARCTIWPIFTPPADGGRPVMPLKSASSSNGSVIPACRNGATSSALNSALKRGIVRATNLSARGSCKAANSADSSSASMPRLTWPSPSTWSGSTMTMPSAEIS